MQTPKGSYQLNIKYLKEAGLFNKVGATADITHSKNIKYKVTYEEDYLRFNYSLNGVNKDYRVYLITRPSNLGRGEIRLFQCPLSSKPCRKLFLNYREGIFCSMKAIRKFRYPIQNKCNRERYNIRYWEIEKELEKLYKKRQSFYYNGKKTRRLKRIERLEGALQQYDYLRMTKGMPVKLQKILNGLNLNNLD